jgi:RNA polymerase sigma factor (sigma-70 family)
MDEFANQLEALLPKLRAHFKRKLWFSGRNQTMDTLHDAVVWALSNPERFDPARGSLSAWLKMTVLRRAVSNSIRAAARDPVRVVAEGFDEEVAGKTGPDSVPWFPAVNWRDTDVALDIETAFAALPAEELAIATAVFVEGKTVEAAAGELDVKKRTAERRLAGARKHLQHALRHYLENGPNLVSEFTLPNAGRATPKRQN